MEQETDAVSPLAPAVSRPSPPFGKDFASSVIQIESPAVRLQRDRPQGELQLQATHIDRAPPFTAEDAFALSQQVTHRVTDQLQGIQEALVQSIDTNLTDAFRSLSLGAQKRAQIRPPPMDVSSRTLKGLRDLYGPEARFKSVQQGQIIEAAVRRDRHILGILPTGGGKTPAFAVPILLERARGIRTVIFVPTNELLKDLHARFQEWGINSAMWISGRDPPPADAIFANYAAADHPAMIQFLTMLAVAGLLGRICIDECHYPLLNMTLRKGLKNLKNLMAFKVPLVLITGTLPPEETASLLQIYGLNPDSVLEIRKRTVRPNLKYRSILITGKDALAESKLELKRKMKTMNFGHLGMVFCRSIDDIIEYRTYLGAADPVLEHELAQGPNRYITDQPDGTSGLKLFVCYAEMDEELKVAAMKQWTEWVDEHGQTAWMLCSNLLGTGIDKPRVDVVIHAGFPSNFMDFAQESGRAGRSGQDSLSLIIYTRLPAPPIDDAGGRTALILAVQNGLCFRHQMHTYLDGIGYTCLSEPESVNLCRVCQNALLPPPLALIQAPAAAPHTASTTTLPPPPAYHAPPVPPVGPMVRALVPPKNTLHATCEEYFARLASSEMCVQCHVLGLPLGNATRHPILACPNLPNPSAACDSAFVFKRDYLRGKILLNASQEEMNNYCTSCLLPQSSLFHFNTSERTGSTRGHCRWETLPTFLIYLAKENPATRLLLAEAMSSDVLTDQLMATWMLEQAMGGYQFMRIFRFLQAHLPALPSLII